MDQSEAAALVTHVGTDQTFATLVLVETSHCMAMVVTAGAVHCLVSWVADAGAGCSLAMPNFDERNTYGENDGGEA
jgi:hypothetical protein